MSTTGIFFISYLLNQLLFWPKYSHMIYVFSNWGKGWLKTWLNFYARPWRTPETSWSLVSNASKRRSYCSWILELHSPWCSVSLRFSHYPLILMCLNQFPRAGIIWTAFGTICRQWLGLASCEQSQSPRLLCPFVSHMSQGWRWNNAASAQQSLSGVESLSLSSHNHNSNYKSCTVSR